MPFDRTHRHDHVTLTGALGAEAMAALADPTSGVDARVVAELRQVGQP